MPKRFIFCGKFHYVSIKAVWFPYLVVREAIIMLFSCTKHGKKYFVCTNVLLRIYTYGYTYTSQYLKPNFLKY